MSRLIFNVHFFGSVVHMYYGGYLPLSTMNSRRNVAAVVWSARGVTNPKKIDVIIPQRLVEQMEATWFYQETHSTPPAGLFSLREILKYFPNRRAC